MEMPYEKYRFRCRFETEGLLPPYKGSAFRGVFGHALKRVVCAIRRQECHTCLLKEQCVYTPVFETSVSVSPPEGSKMTSPPPPFVIEPPLTTERSFPENAPFDFSLILFGRVNNNLPYFIYAFDQMGKLGIGRRIQGKRGKFRLEKVCIGDQEIYSHSDQMLRMPDAPRTLSLADPGDFPSDSFRIRISPETPLRFKFREHLAAGLPFHVLVRAMMRRVSFLLACYGDGDPPLDYRGLAKRAEAVRTVRNDLIWSDWRRYSQRQKEGDAPRRLGRFRGL